MTAPRVCPPNTPSTSKTGLRKSSGSATVVSTPVREKTAEDVTAQLEAFGYRCAGTLDGWIHVPPRSEVFFRPEEVDRRSEPFDSSASLLCSFSDPQHDAGRCAPWAFRRGRELQPCAGVMAASPNLDRLAHHWGNAKGIDRATDMALSPVLETNEEGRGRRRKWIREVHAAVRNADHVLVVQLGESVVNRFVGAMLQPRDDFSDRKRPASIQEHLENPRRRRGLSRGAACPASSLDVEGDELVGRQDHEVPHVRASISVAGALPFLAPPGARRIIR